MKATRKKKAFLALALCCLAGCSNDSAQSLSRDYRNAGNECLDALMMVTGERRAEVAKKKYLKQFSDIVGKIDKRAQTYEQNTDDKVIVSQMISTESVAILVAEMQVNKIRFTLEKDRIKKLLDYLVETEKTRRKAEGEANPDVKASEKWPNLNDIAVGTATQKLYEFYFTANRGPVLLTMFGRFGQKQWKNALPKDWDAQQAKFAESVEKFKRLD